MFKMLSMQRVNKPGVGPKPLQLIHQPNYPLACKVVDPREQEKPEKTSESPNIARHDYPLGDTENPSRDPSNGITSHTLGCHHYSNFWAT